MKSGSDLKDPELARLASFVTFGLAGTSVDY